ncbi:MAG: hypothetical protein ABI618_19765, partial [Nitrospirota bacterium]
PDIGDIFKGNFWSHTVSTSYEDNMETDEYPPFEIGSLLQYLNSGRHISQSFKEDAEQWQPVLYGTLIIQRKEMGAHKPYKQTSPPPGGELNIDKRAGCR